MQTHGEAWEWNIELYGGPLDGLQDTAVTLYDTPAKVLAKCPDVNKKAGQQLLEKLLNTIPDDKRVWIYELRGEPSEFKELDETAICRYDYIRTMKFKEFRERYEIDKSK